MCISHGVVAADSGLGAGAGSGAGAGAGVGTVAGAGAVGAGAGILEGEFADESVDAAALLGVVGGVVGVAGVV